MTRWNLRATLFLLPCLGACMIQLPKEPFISSSLNRNQGQPHRLELRGQDLNAVVDRVISLAKQRELTLVKQESCDDRRCALIFRGKPVDRRILRGTSSQTLGYYSRYFVALDKKGESVSVTAVGVPVLNGEMACPGYLQSRERCSPPELQRHRDADLVASVKREWGYDISGTTEAEMIAGLLAELKRSRTEEQPPPAPRRRRPLIVAVFDIEDQTGAVRSKVLGQLTEYLAAQVTQRASYQVIPRDQLRARLASEKRKSYRECFDQRCQIELGKAMAASKSLATKLIRVGKQCALTALLYDLKTEATERASSIKTGCSEEELLSGVEKLAQALSTAP